MADLRFRILAWHWADGDIVADELPMAFGGQNEACRAAHALMWGAPAVLYCDVRNAERPDLPHKRVKRRYSSAEWIAGEE